MQSGTHILFLPFLLILSAFNMPQLEIIAPADNMVTANNAPALTWTPFPCDYYEIRIDGKITDSVKPDLHIYVPFPLSFGKHSWQVTAMKENTRITSASASFIIEDKPLGNLPVNAVLIRDNWMLQSSLFVKHDGSVLSQSLAHTGNWYKTSLPATVLTALVRNGIYPNPYVGMNNMRIPDSNDEYNKKYNLLPYSHIKNSNPWAGPYWFCNSFEVPVAYQGKTVWLNFSEINYRAAVWLNGKQIADTSEMVGMEQHFKFDVTSLVKHKGKNYLAVAVYPVDVPGMPGEEPLTALGSPGDNMGDGMISKNYTKWDAVGWDWQPAIRDRDMGITEEVYLSVTDAIEIDNLYITSDLPLPDTTSATITLSGDIINHSQVTQKGTIKAIISTADKKITIEKPFAVSPGKIYSFVWDDSNTQQLLLQFPELWWPNGYGKPSLYQLSMEALSDNGNKAIKSLSFGIREVETYVRPEERVIKINGRAIYCKGGNWVMDMMLNGNAKHYEDEILLTRNANMNLLRVWGPTGVPPQALYEAADQYGIMIWQDFLHDYWGTFRNASGYTAPDDVYEKAATAIVLKCRNHPSLIMWCGGNEGVNPREELIVNKILKTCDGRDSRFYLKQSDGDGLHGGGPYHTITAREYFMHDRLKGFSSEIGPSGVPVESSLHKFMPQLGDHWLKGYFPIDETWAYHDATNWSGSDLRKFSYYDTIIRKEYGGPLQTNCEGLSDYLNKAQLVNYEVYRAAIESINKQLWSKASGILLWKLNSSWPSMVWQVYDWYLQAHAGYYGVKCASEPIHIQLNRDSFNVIVINTPYKDISGAGISATLYDTDMKILWSARDTVTIMANSLFKTGWIVPEGNDLSFLKLKVCNAFGIVLSENMYCINKHDDYTMLNRLPRCTLSANVSEIQLHGKIKFIIDLENNSDHIGYMIGCKLQGSVSGSELLPCLWNRNYITLLPGERTKLEVEISNSDMNEKPVISFKAYNMEEPLVVEAK